MSARQVITTSRRISHQVDLSSWTRCTILDKIPSAFGSKAISINTSPSHAPCQRRSITSSLYRTSQTSDKTLHVEREAADKSPQTESVVESRPTTTTTTTVPPTKPKGPARTPPRNRQLAPLPALLETDIEEEFMRGRGPGGQAIQKTSSLVALLHVPTGVRVKSQETRSREKNRQIARRVLAEKVDAHLNGAESRLLQRWDRERKKKEAKKRKGARKRRGTGEEAVEASNELDSHGEDTRSSTV